MGPSEINVDEAWLPDACTLPAAERPPRTAEFDDFSAGAVLDALAARITTADGISA